MTDNTQPEALRLADALEGNARTAWTREEAAAELRSLHARIADLEAQLEAIGAGGVEPLRKISEQPAQAAEPVAWRVHPFDYGIGHEGVYAMTMREEQREAWRRKGWNTEPLFAAPQPVAREPLTRQQLCEAFYSETACTLGGDVDFAEKVCRVVEKAHGIKGGQHGTE